MASARAILSPMFQNFGCAGKTSVILARTVNSSVPFGAKLNRKLTPCSGLTQIKDVASAKRLILVLSHHIHECWRSTWLLACSGTFCIHSNRRFGSSRNSNEAQRMDEFSQEGFLSWFHWLCSAWSFSTKQRMSSALYQRRRGCPHSQETSSGSIFSAAKENSHLLVVAVVGLHVCAAYAPPDRGPALADLTSLTAEYFVSNPNHHAQPFLFALDGKANAKLTILSPIVLIIFPPSWSSWFSSPTMFPSR